jgi:hypothetical protein
MRLVTITPADLRVGMDVAFIESGNGGPVATVVAFDDFIVRANVGATGKTFLFEFGKNLEMYALEDES